ncbi:WD domain-containing protein [Xylona heveae TC161]|uniref:WD domain-containing protein n=1 Tax=Xylona heveae (strain CBS 132557 / TC161) TaxID=1328760 RepID=A0A165FIV6_XYLHT|nr:WD domain-containing protein [Xylona heveae TC161]KZF21029.1 WD domain-containing protein [Xylona heveae TC161]
MKLTNHSGVPVYTIAGSSTARPLPEWLQRKRKRSLKTDPEFANRVELLQDFEFEEASSCIRVSEDGEWVMSTGTYKPQIHTHYLPHLSLSFTRHTNTLNQTFLLLSSDYSKSLHLQTDRFLEFHTPGGCHYATRIPRYGRDLIYDKRSAEALVPSVGVNADGNGEVFRLNLEQGRFMKGYELDVGGDDFTSSGGGALQGGINTGSVNTGAIAEESHNLLAFGTSLGTVEFWDSRSRARVGILGAPPQPEISFEGRNEITALEFDRSGLNLASGSSNGLIYLYDLRSPVPLLKKDQGYGYPIQTLKFLASSTATRAQTSEPKILSSDKRIIKIWDARNGDPWTSVEPAVDLHHVEWCKDSGMLLTANEGRQQHAFFIPQLGPAPKWCAFLDNLVEEMAEDPNDPNAYNGQTAGEVYDNYKFLTVPQLKSLNLDHLVGTTNLLRPYMHGYFVAQRLYEEARLISQPESWEQQRAKSIQEKINRERESRIRGSKKVSVKVNRKLAEKMLERQEKEERRRARHLIEKGQERAAPADQAMDVDNAEDRESDKEGGEEGLLTDSRFSNLFKDEDFAVDETSHEFRALNPSTKVEAAPPKRGLTAVEEEELDERRANSSSEDDDDESSSEEERPQQKSRRDDRISTASYKKAGQRPAQPQMQVSSSSRKPQERRDRSFGSRNMKEGGRERRGRGGARGAGVVGEKQITFAPEPKGKPQRANREAFDHGRTKARGPDSRRSASGNVFRRM